MNWWAEQRRWVALGLCLLMGMLHPAWGQDSEIAMPVKDMRLPLEHWPSGAVKTQLTAGQALVPPQGMIMASNVVLKMFFEDGASNVTVTAASCLYDREKQTAESEDHIKIEREGAVLTGVGFEWSADRERVKIRTKARITFARDLGRTRGKSITDVFRSVTP